jgi:hypothetical protein
LYHPESNIYVKNNIPKIVKHSKPSHFTLLLTIEDVNTASMKRRKYEKWLIKQKIMIRTYKQSEEEVKIVVPDQLPQDFLELYPGIYDKTDNDSFYIRKKREEMFIMYLLNKQRSERRENNYDDNK